MVAAFTVFFVVILSKVWRTDNGERLGTYTGHTGAVWFCNVNRDTTRLLTASADTTAKLWDVQSGNILYWLLCETL